MKCSENARSVKDKQMIDSMYIRFYHQKYLQKLGPWNCQCLSKKTIQQINWQGASKSKNLMFNFWSLCYFLHTQDQDAMLCIFNPNLVYDCAFQKKYEPANISSQFLKIGRIALQSSSCWLMSQGILGICNQAWLVNPPTHSVLGPKRWDVQTRQKRLCEKWRDSDKSKFHIDVK